MGNSTSNTMTGDTITTFLSKAKEGDLNELNDGLNNPINNNNNNYQFIFYDSKVCDKNNRLKIKKKKLIKKIKIKK